MISTKRTRFLDATPLPPPLTQVPNTPVVLTGKSMTGSDAAAIASAVRSQAETKASARKRAKKDSQSSTKATKRTKQTLQTDHAFHPAADTGVPVCVACGTVKEAIRTCPVSTPPRPDTSCSAATVTTHQFSDDDTKESDEKSCVRCGLTRKNLQHCQYLSTVDGCLELLRELRGQVVANTERSTKVCECNYPAWSVNRQ